MTRILLLAALALASIAAQAASTTIALQRVVNDVVTNNTDPQRGTNGAAWVYPAYRMAGERNEDSEDGDDYASVSRECDPQASINLATDASTTYTGPIILCGYTLTVTVGTEAATIDDNATAKVDLPVSWPIGNYPGMDLLFRTSLVVNPGTNSTGTLRVWTRPGDAGVTR